jgi:hypothetical protein
VNSPDAGNVPFSLRYEGPALSEGLMDVRELAPALFAFGNLCDQANRELYGDDSRIEVKIRTVEPGSVIIDMLIWAGQVGGGIGGVVGIMKLWNVVTENADKVSKVVDLVKSGFAVAKVVRGDKSKTALDDAVKRIVVEHHFPELEDHLRRFVQNPVAQDEMSAVARPLRTHGVERLRLISSAKDEEIVEADEVDYIDALPEIEGDEAVIDTPPDNVSTVDKYYRVLTTSVLPNRRWRLTEGSPNEAISVRVADPEILKHAAEGTLGVEVGFFIKARVRSESRFVNNELKTEHFLEAILAIRPPHKQRDEPGLF